MIRAPASILYMWSELVDRGSDVNDCTEQYLGNTAHHFVVNRLALIIFSNSYLILGFSSISTSQKTNKCVVSSNRVLSIQCCFDKVRCSI